MAAPVRLCGSPDTRGGISLTVRGAQASLGTTQNSPPSSACSLSPIVSLSLIPPSPIASFAFPAQRHTSGNTQRCPPPSFVGPCRVLPQVRRWFVGGSLGPGEGLRRAGVGRVQCGR